ncbi:molybdopterin-synthase adenylyltransferase MoeB [Haemophilus haemolyticus]|jgi:molybdopterin synthase sulfurylase moeB|uniref:Molybdopterin-synthase adenylyltransferase n=1 Tax=Haemophilus haemolyticus TaxID=726 RepID=A0A502JK18_HAEHA|nr:MULTISPECIES: molybdopterin-synthase adenylyltransferase MoeB [Haemophilus]NYA25365.1 molybdopterin-synthase adenylyltransferase MoeB [Haemophilus haemolyticus]RDE69559.1 molybdopterin-synthase adenylyltransferase MoeB [Haemophilus haemolyticus]TPG99801.1 molybdopterin-synthase adenylyltransferase MoeB [Haemophilus haemolyticus]TPH06678.1 molybdopterin-synthase adenylyltransferase MoeB [Haemophilus haemolyticus]TPH27324.1 molybdopterin-synthase adenylyltransferase MoeB [Haemophilus haemolyt
MTELSYEEELRYNRQIILKSIDFEGQEKLKDSKMLIVGLGGLGCSASQYLAASGIGHLTLLDFDHVSLSNLQRQVLHCDARLNMPKVESAKIALEQLNPHIDIQTINAKLTEEKLAELIPHFDLVLDCTDNVDIRNQLDRQCEKAHIPLISGAAIRMEGQISVFTYESNTPTYRELSKLFGQNILSCVEAGVIAPIVGIVGSIQALEAIKVRLKIGKNLCGRLLIIDGFSMNIREIKLPINNP